MADPLNFPGDAEDKEKVGSTGIDTQYEHDTINYHPTFDYKKRIDNIESGLDDNDPTVNDLETNDQLSFSDLITTVSQVEDQIKDLETQLNTQLANETVPLSSFSDSDDIREAAQELGVTITDNIPFSLYQLALESDTSAAKLIQDKFEQYEADVNGNINAELYPQLESMKKDWEQIDNFILYGIVGQIDPDMVTTGLDITSDTVKSILQDKEQAVLDSYNKQLANNEADDEALLNLSVTAYGTDQYYQMKSKLDNGERSAENTLRLMNTKSEAINLVAGKASDAQDQLSFIQESIDFDPYPDSKGSMVMSLMGQYSDEKSAISGLSKLSVLLKLTIDQKINNLSAPKATSSQVVNLTNKAKVNGALVNAIYLRNQVVSEAYDLMNNYSGIPSDDDFGVLANNIVDGINQAEESYRQRADDFYKIHTLDTSLRGEQLVGIVNKESARSAYHILQNISQAALSDNSFSLSNSNLNNWVEKNLS